MVQIDSIVRLKEMNLKADVKVIDVDLKHPIEDPFEYKGEIISIGDDKSEGVTAAQTTETYNKGDTMCFDEDDIETVVEE